MKNNSMQSKSKKFDKRYYEASTNIFITYIPQDFTKKDLIKICCPFGRILSAKVMINLKTGLSRCFGFVRFETIESAKKAASALDGTVPEGGSKRLLVRFAGSTMENTGNASNSILVKSLCLFYTKKDIWDLFSRFGEIEEIELIKSKETNYFKGNAIITFSSIFEAQSAIREMNNVRLTPESWPLFIQYTSQRANSQEPKTGKVRYIDGIRVVTNKSFIQDEQSKINRTPITISNNNNMENAKKKELIEPKLNEDYQNYMFSLIAEEL